MNKKDLSESDLKAKFITPAVIGAGWYEPTQLGREIYFTYGRIYVKGKLTVRGYKKVGRWQNSYVRYEGLHQEKHQATF